MNMRKAHTTSPVRAENRQLVVDVKVVSPYTGVETTVTVDATGYRRWVAGESVMAAFPTLSDDDRETLISGMNPAEWAETVGE